MRVRILGSAAGGRFPQWNCGCANCEAVRKGNFAGKPRTQTQLAVSADGVRWFLAGVSPDIPQQIENCGELHPRTLRDSPIAGVVLASADLDHVAGLLLLREFQPLHVYASAAVLRILREENSMFAMLNRVTPQAEWTAVRGDAPLSLLAEGEDSGLRCEVHYLGGRYPKYVRSESLASEEATAALVFESGGKRVVFAPAVGRLTDGLIQRMDRADVLFFDGTFWSDDELQRVKGGSETAHAMGHIPVEESLRLLKDVRAGRKIYIHINNTNPILNEASEEHRRVREAGWEVAEDNWLLEL